MRAWVGRGKRFTQCTVRIAVETPTIDACVRSELFRHCGHGTRKLTVWTILGVNTTTTIFRQRRNPADGSIAD